MAPQTSPLGPAKVRLRHLQDAKERGKPFSALTCFDSMTAQIFEAAGIDVLVVSDAVATTVLGHESATAIDHHHMEVFTAAVARSVHRPIVVAEMAFGSYQTGERDALRHGVDLIRAGAHMVMLEGGREITEQVGALSHAGIPVMGHLGYTPQSVHALAGHQLHNRTGAEVEALVEDAVAIQDAGASALLLEQVPATVAARITEVLSIPTLGMGAGPHCDGQLLNWQDMAGLSGTDASHVKAFASLRSALLRASEDYRMDVEGKAYPDAQHSRD